MGLYRRPTDLADALDVLAASPTPPTILAGGTDVYPVRVGRPLDQDVLDVSAIAGLRRIERVDGGWRIPALATWTDLVRADLPPAFDGLRAAAQTIGGVQIQHRGTIAGNLCNASPAADGLPNLIALDAEVELTSAGGVRRMAAAEFVLGNRRTARRPDELLTSILVPESADDRSASSFIKLGSRAYLVISIASVAARLGFDGADRIATARLVVGACSEVPQRLPDAEARLLGATAAEAIDGAAAIGPDDLAGVSPIDDVRGTAAYRRAAALVLVRRAIEEAVR
jgi:N-methylhydantoinase B